MTWLARLKSLREESEALPEGGAKTAERAFGSYGSASRVRIADLEATQTKVCLYHSTCRASGPRQTEISDSLRRGTAKTARSPDAIRLRDACEERAAITDFDGSLPRAEAELKQASTAPGYPSDWISGVARLSDMPSSLDWPPHRWLLLVEDAEAFLEQWAVQAHRLGWLGWELWGCCRRKPWGAIDGLGLVLLLGGHELVAMTDTLAVIRSPTGNCQRSHRKPRDPLHSSERALIWELGS